MVMYRPAKIRQQIDTGYKGYKGNAESSKRGEQRFIYSIDDKSSDDKSNKRQ